LVKSNGCWLTCEHAGRPLTVPLQGWSLSTDQNASLPRFGGRGGGFGGQQRDSRDGEQADGGDDDTAPRPRQACETPGRGKGIRSP
jgi:hypothetical protein